MYKSNRTNSFNSLTIEEEEQPNVKMDKVILEKNNTTQTRPTQYAKTRFMCNAGHPTYGIFIRDYEIDKTIRLPDMRICLECREVYRISLFKVDIKWMQKK